MENSCHNGKIMMMKVKSFWAVELKFSSFCYLLNLIRFYAILLFYFHFKPHQPRLDDGWWKETEVSERWYGNFLVFFSRSNWVPLHCEWEKVVRISPTMYSEDYNEIIINSRISGMTILQMNVEWVGILLPSRVKNHWIDIWIYQELWTEIFRFSISNSSRFRLFVSPLVLQIVKLNWSLNIKWPSQSDKHYCGFSCLGSLSS